MNNSTSKQDLWEQYRHEMDNEYGFGHPSKWLKGERDFASFLASRRIEMDTCLALDCITKPTACPQHPTADIRHSWDETKMQVRLTGACFVVEKKNHRFECAVCGHELQAP